ncbi:Conjugal transfer protein TrbC (modular protein) [uncultured Desulfobacterium sp.]|uniref:Conjugal transfer protein TrbC (Modular protein) n=1 Tax=uncultured Desulfobacterium sp. TaxID=201089 RepID=A0A445MSM2_9BACT|nr:Conjugal transfer protein TrbC (modular protein) [uncultured Desulfobacterium sp.]
MTLKYRERKGLEKLLTIHPKEEALPFMDTKNCSKMITFLALTIVISLLPKIAFAAATGMPWEGPLDELLNSLTGPVARVLGAVSIIGLGIGLAFSEGGGFARKALWVVMGLVIAFNAVSWGLGFLGFGGGLTI